MADSIELHCSTILLFKRKRKSYRWIVDILGEVGHTCTKSGICSFLKRYEERGSILRKPGTGTKSKKKNSNILELVDFHMEQDDETSLEDLPKIAARNLYSIMCTYILC